RRQLRLRAQNFPTAHRRRPGCLKKESVSQGVGFRASAILRTLPELFRISLRPSEQRRSCLAIENYRDTKLAPYHTRTEHLGDLRGLDKSMPRTQTALPGLVR